MNDLYVVLTWDYSTRQECYRVTSRSIINGSVYEDHSLAIKAIKASGATVLFHSDTQSLARQHYAYITDTCPVFGVDPFITV